MRPGDKIILDQNGILTFRTGLPTGVNDLNPLWEGICG